MTTSTSQTMGIVIVAQGAASQSQLDSNQLIPNADSNTDLVTSLDLE